jgi:cellobiose phosphorylase
MFNFSNLPTEIISVAATIGLHVIRSGILGLKRTYKGMHRERIYAEEWPDYHPLIVTPA